MLASRPLTGGVICLGWDPGRAMESLLADIVGLYRTAAALKELPRQGWIMGGGRAVGG